MAPALGAWHDSLEELLINNCLQLGTVAPLGACAKLRKLTVNYLNRLQEALALTPQIGGGQLRDLPGCDLVSWSSCGRFPASLRQA